MPSWQSESTRFVDKRFVHIIRFHDNDPEVKEQASQFRGTPYKTWSWHVDVLDPRTGEVMDGMPWQVGNKHLLRKLADVFPEGSTMKGITIKVSPTKEMVKQRDGSEQQMNAYEIEKLEGEWWLEQL